MKIEGMVGGATRARAGEVAQKVEPAGDRGAFASVLAEQSGEERSDSETVTSDADAGGSALGDTDSNESAPDASAMDASATGELADESVAGESAAGEMEALAEGAAEAIVLEVPTALLDIDAPSQVPEAILIPEVSPPSDALEESAISEALVDATTVAAQLGDATRPATATAELTATAPAETTSTAEGAPVGVAAGATSEEIAPQEHTDALVGAASAAGDDASAPSDVVRAQALETGAPSSAAAAEQRTSDEHVSAPSEPTQANAATSSAAPEIATTASNAVTTRATEANGPNQAAPLTARAAAAGAVGGRSAALNVAKPGPGATTAVGTELTPGTQITAAVMDRVERAFRQAPRPSGTEAASTDTAHPARAKNKATDGEAVLLESVEGELVDPTQLTGEAVDVAPEIRRELQPKAGAQPQRQHRSVSEDVDDPFEAAHRQFDAMVRGRRQRAATSAVNHMTLRQAATAEVEVPELGLIRVDARTIAGEVDVDVRTVEAATAAVLQSASAALEGEIRNSSIELRNLDISDHLGEAPNHRAQGDQPDHQQRREGNGQHGRAPLFDPTTPSAQAANGRVRIVL